jgi:hypothetical protein
MLRTGVPAFLGFAEKGDADSPTMLTRWAQFESQFSGPLQGSALAYAVRGFFANGGELCYVVRLRQDPTTTLDETLCKGLATLEHQDTVDLVCAPGVVSEQTSILQQRLLDHCEKAGDRLAILDAGKNARVEDVLAQRRALHGTNGALYYPWIAIEAGPAGGMVLAPPCGHVAGVYARTDRRTGVHKAPANEVLEDVLDLEINLGDKDQAQLNPEGVNCLRAFPGRGIRVWGARTLSNDPNWSYVNVRRLFLTAGRWIERNLTWASLEPNDPRLWARITRELTGYFDGLFRQGALKGRTAQEAFYVKCDAETNPSAVRDAGRVVTEIGLAPAVPHEFIVVRITHGANGMTVTGPDRPG